ncbi:MAG: hypothetical protein WC718_12260 [Phycisphaerales bacterium]|jgi:hypothetical protein
MSNVNVMSVRGAAGAAFGRDASPQGLEETFTPTWGVAAPWQAPGRDAGQVVAEDEDDDMDDDDEGFGDDDEFEEDEGFEEEDEDFLEDDEEEVDGESEEDDEDDDDDL